VSLFLNRAPATATISREVFSQTLQSVSLNPLLVKTLPLLPLSRPAARLLITLGLDLRKPTSEDGNPFKTAMVYANRPPN
jgi:hypothetical protein